MYIQDEHNLPESTILRNKLAVAVRSVQWSYAIFWALSTTQQGVLEWGEGYYNGDIKTSKSVESKDLDAHNLGLQRSEQLRKLYESLLEGESELVTKRPSGALSPEDLSNLEWYYLVCMSFTFNFGQSLPGKALATGQHIWLFDAQSADSKVFSRSILAKSASVQTVICFPHMGNVIELGITELVPEDLNLIQHIRITLMEVVKPSSEKLSYALCDTDYCNYHTGTKLTEHGYVDTISLSKICPSGEKMKFENASEDVTLGFDDCSNDDGYHAEESFMLDSTTSPFQNWYLIDDDLSQSLQDSTTFHGSLPQNFDSQEDPKLLEAGLDRSGSIIMNDTHYRNTLSVILESRNHLITDQNTSVRGCGSSFVHWKKDYKVHHSTIHPSQRILKMILFKVPLMHAYATSKSLDNEGTKIYPLKPEASHLYMLNCTSEESIDNGMLCTPEEKINSEQYMILKSMLPSVTKTDEASILMDTIEYLKELEARVDELESCIDYKQSSATRYLDLLEHTSDNYERVEDEKTPSINKGKASEIYETSPMVNQADIQPSSLEVNIVEHEVLIKLTCPLREHLLIDIMEAVNDLNLDTHTVQSSTLNGILSMFLKTMIQGPAFISDGIIKQALRRTIGIFGEVN